LPNPGNMGGSGQLVIVDFGAAKVATGTALGRTGTAIGSAGYSAPEQNFGRAVFASDLYGLGVTCIHLLTNQHPYDLFDPNENAWVWRQALPSPVTEQLSRILNKMVASAINQRYQSAAEILQELNPPTPLALPVQQQPIATPVKAQPPVIKSNSLIDAELAELKSQFLGVSTPKPSAQPTPGKASPPAVQKSPSQIDLELEEMRSQFLTNHPKQPPTST
jgi:serine/threonine protein kinase